MASHRPLPHALTLRHDAEAIHTTGAQVVPFAGGLEQRTVLSFPLTSQSVRYNIDPPPHNRSIQHGRFCILVTIASTQKKPIDSWMRPVISCFGEIVRPPLESNYVQVVYTYGVQCNAHHTPQHSTCRSPIKLSDLREPIDIPSAQTRACQ